MGEPSGARRIPEEGAQRPTKLYWVLGAVSFLASHTIARDKDVEGNSFITHVSFNITQSCLSSFPD